MRLLNSKRYMFVFVIGLALVVFSGVAFVTKESGYDDFVKAFDKSMLAKEGNLQYEFSVSENNITNLSGIIKLNSNAEETYMSSNFKTKAEEISYEVYGKGNDVIFKSNDKYYRSQSNYPLDKRYAKFEEFVTRRITKTGLSMAVGDAKRYFVKEGDTVKVHLERSQVPSLSRIVFGLAAHTNFITSESDMLIESADGLSGYRNIDVERIDAEFVIRDEKIALYDISVLVTADDSNGRKNTLQIDNKINVDYSKADIKKFDLEGKEVLPIEQMGVQ